MGSLSRSDLRAVVGLARILPPALRRLDDRDVLLELDGVWGGMTTEQRRPLLGTKPKQVPA